MSAAPIIIDVTTNLLSHQGTSYLSSLNICHRACLESDAQAPWFPPGYLKWRVLLELVPLDISIDYLDLVDIEQWNASLILLAVVAVAIPMCHGPVRVRQAIGARRMKLPAGLY